MNVSKFKLVKAEMLAKKSATPKKRPADVASSSGTPTSVNEPLGKRTRQKTNAAGTKKAGKKPVRIDIPDDVEDASSGVEKLNAPEKAEEKNVPPPAPEGLVGGWRKQLGLDSDCGWFKKIVPSAGLRTQSLLRDFELQAAIEAGRKKDAECAAWNEELKRVTARLEGQLDLLNKDLDLAQMQKAELNRQLSAAKAQCKDFESRCLKSNEELRLNIAKLEELKKENKRNCDLTALATRAELMKEYKEGKVAEWDVDGDIKLWEDVEAENAKADSEDTQSAELPLTTTADDTATIPAATETDEPGNEQPEEEKEPKNGESSPKTPVED